MKKVFTIFSPILFKGFVLLFCISFLFSQNVFSLDEIATNSPDVVIDLKSVTTEKSENSEDESSEIKDLDECSGQTCLSTTEDAVEEGEGDLIVPLTTPDEISNQNEIIITDTNTENPETEDTIEIIDKNTSTVVATDLKPVLTKTNASLEPSKDSQEKSTPTKKVLGIDIYDIRINEVLANPDGTDSSNEFIELYNDSDIDVSLENWCLHDKTQKCYNFGDVIIQSNDFLLLYNNTDFSFSLNNSDEELYLKDASENIISEYSYAQSSSGLSWNYDNVWYEEIPTPNSQNNQNPLTKEYPQIVINELLPNPSGDESTSEFIELYNPNNVSVELKNWILRDASTSGKYIISQIEIAPLSYLTIFRSDFSFALNNSGTETVSLIAPNTQTKSTISYNSAPENLSYNSDSPNWYWETPTPNNENSQNPLTKEYPQIIINEILPNPRESEEVSEFIELYNSTKNTVSLKNWILTDASATGSHTFTQKEILPHSHFTIYRSEFKFALNNSGSETISLIAPNNKILSTMSYSETREGMSLNRATQWYHAQPTPNNTNAIDPRTLTYPNLLLSEILPNPSGDEGINEFIEIYNPNNIKVNLKNWLLKDASKTGSYTFADDNFIAPHDYFTIYRKDFSFALNNSNETVALVAPNEKVTDTISYKSARENISYNYNPISKNWRWSRYLTPKRKNILNNLPTITKFNIDKKAYKNVYVEFDADAHDKDGEELKVRWDFGDGRKSYLWETQHKYTEIGVYHGHLRIQDGSEEIIKNFTVTVQKYPKYEIKITKIVPNPAGKDSGAEFIIIKNKSNKKINLKNWSIATGSSEKKLVNHPVNEKLIIKHGETKKITKKYAAISLPNKAGVIEIRRPNGSVSDTRKYGDKNISIPDNASYEKIDELWQWIIPQDLEKIAEINAIIAQAIANEGFLSQQRLEQLVAFDAVYNPLNTKQSTSQIDDYFFTRIMRKLNTLLNKTIVIVSNMPNYFYKPKTIANVHPLYNIPNTSNPCDKFFTLDSTNINKFHFCN